MCSSRQVRSVVKQAKYVSVVLLTLSLTACGDGIANHSGKRKSTVDATASAVFTPLRDLNIMSDDIHPKLQALVEHPYSTPKPLTCKGVKEEVAELDGLLGEDVDAPKVALTANEQYAQTGSELVQDGLVSLVRSQTSFLPFRGIIRRITGADAHDKAIAQATQAGKLRRAYLKGLANAKFGDKCSFEPILVTEDKKDDEKKAEESPPVEVAKK